jgi:hypothetical protein
MEERKINIDRKPLSSAEIASRKNFNQVVKGAGTPSPIPFYKAAWFVTSVGIIAIVCTTIIASKILTQKDENLQTATTASPPIEEFADYSEDTPCVVPPIKEQDITSSLYKINAEQGGTIIHTSGTEIKISQNAFMNNNGAKITGEIEIRYREFQNQLDILFSGIPMKYDSAGLQYNFESAGMMEIQGFQNGEAVFIVPEKPIEVKMRSYNDSPKFNLYYLDESKKHWLYKGKDKIETLRAEDQLTTSTDVDEVENRPELIKQNNEIISLTQEKSELIEMVKKAANEVVKHKESQPVRPAKINESNFNFDIAVNPIDFPELSIYKDVLFEVEPSDKNFTSEVYNIKWSDAKISEVIKGKKYHLTLTKGVDIRVFDVYPAFDEKNYPKAMLVFDQKFKSYSAELNKRLKTEQEKKAELEKKINEIAQAKKEQARLLEQYYKETNNSVNENATAIEGLDKNNQQISTRTRISRTFEVLTFGIWNADCTIPAKPKGQTIKAFFVDAFGLPILLKKVQLLIRSKNTVYNYSSVQLEKFKWNPKEMNTIVAITHNGKIGIVSSDYINNIPTSHKEHTFVLELMDGKTISKQNLRKKLELI